MALLESILGKLHINGKQAVVLDDTAENGGIERGSNANGSYVKFPDGTLICQHSGTGFTTETAVGSLFSDDATQWTFPYAFIGSPTVDASSSSTSYTWFAVQTIGGTSAFIRAWRVSSNAVSLTVQYTAIGRWK